jgi:hypothetical protein
MKEFFGQNIAGDSLVTKSLTVAVCVLACIVFNGSTAFAQLVQLPHYTPAKHSRAAFRTRQLAAMPLPFWDDFSTAVKDTTAKWVKAADTLWIRKSGTRITDGAGIKPRSFGVAVFDGLDSLGKPYELDLIASGFTDGLTSRSLKLADVLPANRDSVYLSFAYQWKGNGEAPDPADYLQVDFKNETGQWEPVSIISGAGPPGGGSYNPELFYDFIIKVSEARFFHNEFQFRIQRYGRRSGPFDTWMVDYVYLNEHRFENDLSFTDRSLATHLTSLFNGYGSVPIDHFFEAPVLSRPSMNVANLQNGKTVLEYSSFTNSINYAKDTVLSKSAVIPLDVKSNIKQFIEFQKKDTLINKLPNPSDVSLFNPLADSILLILKVALNSGDNLIKGSPLLSPEDKARADYIPRIYAPIDFRSNDTTLNYYTLSQYYAYDDGRAEYSAGLAQGGNIAVMQFTQFPTNADTLSGIYIYFTERAGIQSNTVELLFYENDNGLPGELLAELTIPVRRLGVDVFQKVKFGNGIVVPKVFYIGWREPLSGKVAIGLDKSTDNSDKIFSNSNGTWLPPANLTGTLMIRPIFAQGIQAITTVEKTAADIHLYPNPVDNNFTINTPATVEAITTVTGLPLSFSYEIHEGKTQVTLPNPVAGMAFVHIKTSKGTVIKKILAK